MATTLAVTGKGGVGKTTVAALIIRCLKERATGPILALDADPDCNLGAVLGIPVETTIGDLREDIQKAVKNFPAGMSKENYVQAGLHGVIAESEKVDLITMGRGEGPGCYCFINHLLRKFADDLVSAYDWLVMDNEAGMEHLSRRTTCRVDHLIVVADDNPLAMDCARRVDGLLASLPCDVRRAWLLLNDVPADRIAEVRRRAEGLRLEFLGALPHDPGIEETLYRRKPIFQAPHGPAPSEVDRIMSRIGGLPCKSPT